MIESGTLNDRIRFLSPVTIRNKYGEQLTSWELSYSCWAKVTYNKGVRAITAGGGWVAPNGACPGGDKKKRAFAN